MNSKKRLNLDDKKLLIQRLIEIYTQKMELAKKAMEGSQQDAIEAESAMQTRYGSTKEEKQMLMDAYAGKVIEYQKTIASLHQVPIKENNIVEVMSLVCCKNDRDSEESWYLIVPIGGGEDIEIDNLPVVTSLSYSSPLARSLIGAKTGDKRETGTNILHVLQVI